MHMFTLRAQYCLLRALQKIMHTAPPTVGQCAGNLFAEISIFIWSLTLRQKTENRDKRWLYVLVNGADYLFSKQNRDKQRSVDFDLAELSFVYIFSLVNQNPQSSIYYSRICLQIADFGKSLTLNYLALIYPFGYRNKYAYMYLRTIFQFHLFKSKYRF